MTTDDILPAPLLTDAHVHLHEGWDPTAFLDSALLNLRAGAAELDLPTCGTGVLFFAEAEGCHEFRRFARSIGGITPGPWRFRETEETISLLALRDGSPKLVLVSGRQVATADGLEVLALGIDGTLPSGLGLRDTVARVRHRGGVPVLPWGFGKWWLGRGSKVRDLVFSSAHDGLFLGDNGGRPRMTGRPRLFREAESLDIPVLPGSDPLPFADHADRVGSYGFALHGRLRRHRPGEDVKRILRDLESTPPTFGRLRSLPRFCRDQAAMRLRGRARAS